MAVTADDFEKKPGSQPQFGLWRLKKTIRTYVGACDVIIYEPPDDEQLRVANALVSFVLNQNEEILDKIYEHYGETAEKRHWMKGYGVPWRLDRRGVIRYMRGLEINVIRTENGFSGSIFILPQWEPEHGIELQVRDGVLVSQNW
jgi:hypothetical protein